ncbi:hypothetical protein TDIS_0366 [Thermosulfurimonas dismutans]|uniref:Uncharacterized protein n=1 Tax=Thermosulfurimonas dismutans TaxID=999894 RepID=A0A179D8F0_9BACT|nr:hypothetical protein TDIS_0366 [Thermosulfurimonas dismutans]
MTSGGKSGLRRAGRRVTPGGGNPWKVPQKTDRLGAWPRGKGEKVG